MSEPFTKGNVASMANRAASEIESQRAKIAELAPKAEAYDLIRTILGLLPRTQQGYGEDVAYMLRRRADELLKQGDEK